MPLLSQDPQDRQNVYNKLAGDAYSVLKEMALTKFQSVAAIHDWLSTVIEVAEQSDNLSRAIAANIVMLVVSKELNESECDYFCMEERVQDEILSLLEMP